MHHVAHTFTRTTFPSKDAMLTLSPASDTAE
jgi:hypothetical protein